MADQNNKKQGDARCASPKSENRNALGIQLSDRHASAIYPSIEIDFALYEHYFADEELSEEQKRELMQVLWSIMLAFVDLGFGVHPLQQACEQNEVYHEISNWDLQSLLQSNSGDQIEPHDNWKGLKPRLDDRDNDSEQKEDLA